MSIVLLLTGWCLLNIILFIYIIIRIIIWHIKQPTISLIDYSCLPGMNVIVSFIIIFILTIVNALVFVGSFLYVLFEYMKLLFMV